MLSDLKYMAIEGEYVEVNSDHMAYQMVRPEWVVEISCLDLLTHNTRGGTVNRVVLEYESKGREAYKVVRRMPLATVISPQFVRHREDRRREDRRREDRRREDKRLVDEDIRIEQVSQVDVHLADADARSFALPTSEVLRREVYTKEPKGEVMIRKFVMLQTNKDTSTGEYPAYVIHYTDFNPNRKVLLAREVVVSNSRSQIDQLYEQFKEENIKKGWNPHQATEAPAVAVIEIPPAEPVEKKAKAPRKKAKDA